MPIIEEEGKVTIRLGNKTWEFTEIDGVAKGHTWMGQLTGDCHGVTCLPEIPCRVGSLYGPPVMTPASKACTANTIYYVPLVLWKGWDWDSYYTDRIQLAVTVGKTGGRARVGIYDNVWMDAKPNELFLDCGEMLTSTAGAQYIIIDSYPLTKGLWWIAVHNRVQSTAYAGYNALDHSLLGVQMVGASIKPIVGYTEPRAYADGLPMVATCTINTNGAPWPLARLFPRDWIG